MKLYKLTDSNDRTRGDTQWGENITHKAKAGGGLLCSPKWIHFYQDKYLAVLLNPTHANIRNPHLWTFRPDGKQKHEWDKSGCKSGTTIKRIPVPRFSTLQKVAFAIFCAAKDGRGGPAWDKWAEDWLSGKDRSAARASALAPWSRSYAALRAAEVAEAGAAWGAAWAAYTEAADIDFTALALKAYKWKP